MRKSHNEQGYALLIVLFLIVFIMAVSAVFIRGTLGNAKQEIKVDESHLIVTAAEAGVDYYTWEIDQFYTENQQNLYEEFKKAIEIAIKKATDEKKDIESIDYNDIQVTVISEFIDNKFKPFLKEKVGEQKNIGKEYSHAFTGFELEEPKRDLKGIKIILKGNVEGQYKGETSLLDFDLVFIIPSIVPNKSDENTDGETIIIPSPQTPKMPGSPKNPAEPVKLAGITKPKNLCEDPKKISKDCFLKSADVDGSNVDKAKVVVENTFSSWGTITVKNLSQVNIFQNFKAQSINLANSELVTGSSMNAYGLVDLIDSSISIGNNIGDSDKPSKLTLYNSNMEVNNNVLVQSTDIKNSTIKIGGEYQAGNLGMKQASISIGGNLNSGTAKLEEIILKVGGKYNVGGGALSIFKSDLDIHNDFLANNGSTLESVKLAVGGTYINSNAIWNVKESEVSVGKNVDFGNGSDLSNVIMSVKGQYIGPGGIKGLNTHLSIGNNLIAGNGTDLTNVVLSIGGNFETPVKFISKNNTSIFVGGNLEAGNGSTLNDTILSVKGNYNTPVKFEFQDSTVTVDGTLYTGNTGEFSDSILKVSTLNATGLELNNSSVVYADNISSDTLRITNSKICTKNLKVRQITADSSPIYYLDDSNNKSANVIKLSPAEFQKHCNIGDGQQKPQFPGALIWEDTYLEKVEYK